MERNSQTLHATDEIRGTRNMSVGDGATMIMFYHLACQTNRFDAPIRQEHRQVLETFFVASRQTKNLLQNRSSNRANDEEHTADRPLQFAFWRIVSRISFRASIALLLMRVSATADRNIRTIDLPNGAARGILAARTTKRAAACSWSSSGGRGPSARSTMAAAATATCRSCFSGRR